MFLWHGIARLKQLNKNYFKNVGWVLPDKQNKKTA